MIQKTILTRISCLYWMILIMLKNYHLNCDHSLLSVCLNALYWLAAILDLVFSSTHLSTIALHVMFEVNKQTWRCRTGTYVYKCLKKSQQILIAYIWHRKQYDKLCLDITIFVKGGNQVKVIEFIRLTLFLMVHKFLV